MTEGYLLDPLYIGFGLTLPVCCCVFYKLGRIFSLISRMNFPTHYDLKHATRLHSQQGSASVAEQVVKPQLSAKAMLLLRGRHYQPFSMLKIPQVTQEGQNCF